MILKLQVMVCQSSSVARGLTVEQVLVESEGSDGTADWGGSEGERRTVKALHHAFKPPLPALPPLS